ncbi:MAG TPA: hypothetical protein VHE54_05490 [Puia sp.]|nr:hypothetical protein [Puia sp.]
MRRLSAILLMGILFFNWYGYQLLSAYWQQQADSKLEASLDRNEFDESQLVSIKVPITNLSYYNSCTSFERVDGRIDVGGVPYKYVKRRIFKDSLELLCIPNVAAIRLRQSKNDFFRQVNDLQQQKQGRKNSSAAKDISKDYAPSAMDVDVPALAAEQRPARTVFLSPMLPSRFGSTPEMPPDAIRLLQA